ncbi:MAG: hypothetical protein Q7K16_04400 [Candidatus Azambacteria bacterium]|nr:hypothetical protein [Candidatus Azambacteria bacterium]
MAKGVKIGIIGVGILGGAVKSYFEDEGYEVFCYDKFKGIGSVEEVNNAQIIFICVPTPRNPDNSCDWSVVYEAVNYITGGIKIVVIKSTIPPFTTYKLQAISKHMLLFNPEFLTEKRAHIDFRFPKIQLIGYTVFSNEVAPDVLRVLPIAGFSKIMPAAAAEMFKYVRNCQLATKNAFFSQIYDLCQSTGIDYGYIKQTAENDPWIGREHLDPVRDGYRGFNGKCLPKDTEAFLKWAEGKGIDLSVLRTAVEFNSALLASQKINKDS